MRIQLIIILIGALSFTSCKVDKEKSEKEAARIVDVPEFNPDSALTFVQKQVDFGPRIPNTAAHRKAADYFIQEFKKNGAVVMAQSFSATNYDNQKLNLTNIIASFNNKKKKRILLAAHWDTRPMADKDLEKPTASFDGANDGASGVGVLLEIARVINNDTALNVGVDIILFDGEDGGEAQGRHTTWCLGSQHWSKNKHTPNYSAYFGILLDMVGGKNAQFAHEGYSMEYAPSVVDKVWNAASRLGFSHYFINTQTGLITDDHQFVNEIGKIPMIDIISYDADTDFGDFHHTRNDNMEIISKETLQAVGQTVLHVVYYE